MALMRMVVALSWATRLATTRLPEILILTEIPLVFFTPKFHQTLINLGGQASSAKSDLR
jgi:hypothetical protein